MGVRYIEKKRERDEIKGEEGKAMSRKWSQERSQGEFAKSAEEMQARLWSWRRGEPEASFDEVMDRVRQEREALLKPLVEGLVSVAREFEVDVSCPACGGGASAGQGEEKEENQRCEGAVKLNREYHFFPSCAPGFFPLDRRLGLKRRGWSPLMLQMALRRAVELGSNALAARNFSELTNVPISANSLQRLVMEYGTGVVLADGNEAEAMVCVPKEEAGFRWRRIPEPDSEMMVVSTDGVMVHLREEGWQEARVASVSAARPREAGENAEEELRLTKHSYRAGLWDAKSFTNHYWAESYRRGVEKAKRIVCINDGAI